MKINPKLVRFALLSLAAVLLSLGLSFSTHKDTNAANGTYKILAWNDLGMHCYNNDFSDLAVLPPYNTLWVQVVQSGDPPKLVTSGITVTYSYPDNTYSVGKINFWTYAKALFGADLAPNVGLKGKSLSGSMDLSGDHFVAEGIPITEYSDSAPTVRQPYQLAVVVVSDSTSGAVLATQSVVTPTSSEMRCDKCHSDNGIAAPSHKTGKVATNILQKHDEDSGTSLMTTRPVLCASCHSSNALGAPGKPGLKSLSNAMHEQHSEVIPNTLDGCYNCHPGPQTNCLRDVMSQAKGMTCVSCHGNMSKVSQNSNPWLNEPRCDTCHNNGQFNQNNALYRFSTGHGGLYCESCHDSTHAIAPSLQANDSIKFIALQGKSGPLSDCRVCHTTPPAGNLGPHGANFVQTNIIAGNAGIPDAVLNYTDGSAKYTLSDSNGNYSLAVTTGWSGTITPVLTGTGFTPASKTYTNVSANLAAENYSTVDNVPPSVVSIVRANNTPTSASTVNFTVTFSEAVTGVDTTDFAITQSGLTGTSVTNLSGSGASYTVTASTGSGNNGTLRLDLVDNDSIIDAASNPLGGVGAGNGSFTSGETYTILKNVLGAGTYDDPNAGITYTGSWSPNAVSGPYLGTIHTTSHIGDSALITFTGKQFKIIYLGAPTAGILDVYVDSTKVASINQYGANWDQQKVWTSDLFAAGTHTLRLVYASGGSFADLDGLQVLTTPALLASGVNDDTAANLNYEGRWYTLTGVTGPASGSLHYSSAPGDDLQGSFTGQQFRLTYLASPFSGLADLYIDGVKIATLNQYSDNWDWQTTWTSGLLSAGTHSFRMVYANGGSLVSLDALEVVSSPAILGTNSYDDGNAGLNYQGRWYTFSAMTGPSLGTLHYMNYQDGTAMLLFSGRQFRLTYLAAPNAGVMDVYVDNVKVTSLNQYSDTWDWQRVWSSDLYASGTHSLRLVNANGVMTNVDGVEILGSPSILGTNVYDDLAAGLNYDGNWQKVSAVSGAYNSTFQYSNGVGENLEVPFNGRQIKLTYLTSPTFGTADVYIDGVKVTTLDQSSADWTFGVTWTSAVLSAGDHSLRLVHAGGAVVTIDAAEVIP